MLADQSRRVIHYFDSEGRPGKIRYNELMISMGENRLLSLDECLQEEEDKILEFRQNAVKLSEWIRKLNKIYDQIDEDPHRYYYQCHRKISSIDKLSGLERLKLLNEYYTLNKTHSILLDNLTSHLLAGSEEDLSPHSISLLRRAIDYTCRMMRHKTRITNYPAAVHAIESARGAAKNVLRIPTIIATLMHDVLEERLDLWTEKLIEKELRNPSYGEYSYRPIKEIPMSLRYRIIQKNIDDYNDRASAIFFSIGLTLYDHLHHFPVPVRYYETLHSVAEMIAALSRRRDQSYYSYLQGLLYPKSDAPLDEISYRRLVDMLRDEFPEPSELLDPYLANVHNFYFTDLGQYCSREEVRRNAFREILAKIFDRLNNTRDMAREHGFSIAKRLYGTAFKNIFFVQAIEDKLRRPGFNTEERRAIENKFINKPKVAALYQVISDLEYLREQKNLGHVISFLEKEMNRYLGTYAFRCLTPLRMGGYFNGLIYMFNEITLGRKHQLVELEKRPDKIAEVLVAFRAVLEAFLAYPALQRDAKAKGRDKEFKPYRIKGMGPSLERHATVQQGPASILTLKTFNRRVV